MIGVFGGTGNTGGKVVAALKAKGADFTCRVSDGTFQAAVDVLGEKGVMDLVALMGYYDFVSMALNVDRYPLPEGASSPFPEPR